MTDPASEDPLEAPPKVEAGGRHRPDSPSSTWWAEDSLYSQLYTDASATYATSVLLGDTAGHPLVPSTSNPDGSPDRPKNYPISEPSGSRHRRDGDWGRERQQEGSESSDLTTLADLFDGTDPPNDDTSSHISTEALTDPNDAPVNNDTPPPSVPPVTTPQPQSRLSTDLALAESGRSARISEAIRPLPKQGRRPRIRHPKHPAIGLLATICVGLFSTFFSWVTAEPLLLTIGHSRSGVATVTHCAGDGLTRRCLATFTDGGGQLVAQYVPLVGATSSARTVGATFEARMVADDGRAAYVNNSRGDAVGWIIGLICVLACGIATAWVSGASRLATRRLRMLGALASLIAPLMMLLGMIVVSW